MGGSGIPPPQPDFDSAQKQEQIALADRLIEHQVKVLGALYDKSSAYTNVVMFAGYATYFGVWGYVRGHLTPLTELSAALSMIISAGTFVFWEVAKMAYMATRLKAHGAVAFDESIRGDPQAVLRYIQATENATNRATVWF